MIKPKYKLKSKIKIFDLAGDKTKPHIVITSKKQIQSVGTKRKVNVNRFSDIWKK